LSKDYSRIFNHVTLQGANADISAVDLAINDSSICDLLISDAHLANKINPAMLHRHCRKFGTSPISILLGIDAGVKLFTSSPIIRSKISMQILFERFQGSQFNCRNKLYIIIKSPIIKKFGLAPTT
jgi:hypothetical protein